jgi:ribosomal protein L14E/L6E/L27E
MGKPRREFSYSSLLKKLVLKLSEAAKALKEMGYESQTISPREFYDYMTGETPTGDTITIVDVLDNKFLMIHEVVEISELKKKRVPINKQTVMNTYTSVVETHYTATEYELDYATDKKDYEWLKMRMNHAKSWLEEPNMPHQLVQRHRNLMKKLSKALESSSKDKSSLQRGN